MKPIPVTSIRFTNSVHVGKSEQQFFRVTEGKHQLFDISIVDMFVRVECLKTNDVTWAPLFAVMWWKGPEPKAEKAPAATKQVDPGFATEVDAPKPKAKVKL